MENTFHTKLLCNFDGRTNMGHVSILKGYRIAIMSLLLIRGKLSLAIKLK